jgi:cellulose synthase/poly-beta-1,6-N-acetylglucosamine synthase-like glycosyltransferase
VYTPTVLVFYFAATTNYVPTDNFVVIRWVMLLLFVPIFLKYVLQLVIAPFFPVVEYMRKRKRDAFIPTVSVLIPAWNEEVGIKSTIVSVLGTRYPKLQVIVVNDGSTDRTHEVVTSFIAHYMAKPVRHRAQVEYVRVPNGGKARAMNAGLKVATGEILITIDADSAMRPNTIENMVKHFTDARVASVAGNVIIGNRTRAIGLIQQLEYHYGFYFKKADALLNAVYIVGGAAAAYRRELVVSLGGFDENMITEDIEMSTRLQDEGHYVRYAPDAVVYTEGPSDFAGLCKQRLRWKYGRFLTFLKYKHLFFSFNKKHNFFLSYVILPTALFAEFLLFFEGVLLAVFYAYTIYTNDYMPLAVVITALTVIVSLQILSDSNAKDHKNLFLFAPGAWIIFYIMDAVEYQALIRSLIKFIKKEGLTWQRWARVGVFSDK